MGLSLVFLLAKASSELNNMVKVRTEMEALLKQVVRETSGGGGNGLADTPADRNPESTTSSCVTDRNDHSASAPQEEVEQQAVSSGTKAASCEKSSEEEEDDECCRRASVDGLEEEFHAELERLQVAYGSDIPLFAAEGGLDSEVRSPRPRVS